MTRLLGNRWTFRGLIAALLAGMAAAASAETLMMPARSGLVGSPVIVWGLTTQKLIGSCSITFGDGHPVPCTVTDNSYIAFSHTYTTAGAYTARLRIGDLSGKMTETAEVVLHVSDPASISADQLRNIRIEMAIQDGLRYLWTAQDPDSRQAFSVTNTTNWRGPSWTALVVLAFQNHGYRVPNDNVTPITGLYEKYVVRRGLNDLTKGFSTETLSPKDAGNPCVGSGTDDGTSCVGLLSGEGRILFGYANSIAMLPLAASGALNRIAAVAEIGTEPYAAGRTYGEILQRLTNAMAWGQGDVSCGIRRGGWRYYARTCEIDGSVAGWNVLAILAAEAVGITLPVFMKPEFSFAIAQALGPFGTFDHPYAWSNQNFARTGVGLLALYFSGEAAPFPALSPGHRALSGISSRWSNNGGNCTPDGNMGCAYAMFNIFKGLKLLGVTTLPGVSRLAGPGAQPAGDWHADYQDWLVENQTNPNHADGGSWNTMEFSSHADYRVANAAIAELLLAPVALVFPDVGTFSTVGLIQLTSSSAAGAGLSHTVIANARGAGDTPIPGTTVVFKVLTGPNAGRTGSAVTGQTGLATFAYFDTGGAGIDTIQAFVGTMGSNALLFEWTAAPVNTAPAFTPPADIEIEAAGPGGTVVTFAAAGEDAEDGPVAAVCAPPSGSVFALGATRVDCTVTDAAGSTASGSFTVTVVDTTAPAVAVPSPIVVQATSPLGTLVTFSASATDIVDGPTPVTCAAPSGSTFPITMSTVVCTAVDRAGNASTGTFIVSVTNTPPVLTPPTNIQREAIGPGGTMVTFSAAGEDAEDGPIAAVCAPPSGGLFPLGTTRIDCSVTDVAGSTASGSFDVTIVDTTAPTITVPSPIVVHATSAAGALLSFSASATDIVDGPVPVTCAASSGSTFPIATSTVICTAVDRAGNASTGSFTVSVTNTPPVCSAAVPSLGQIWPPNHALVEITVLGVSDPDGDPLSVLITRIFQDEPTNTQGDGNTAIDGFGVGTGTARVRAERDGNPKQPGNGRVYYIRFSANDGLGGTCSGEVKVGVPHDRGKGPAIGDGPLHDSTVRTGRFKPD